MEAPASRLDAVRDEILTRKNEIGLATARSLNGNGAASSKLVAYRESREQIQAHQRSAEQLLASPMGPQRPQRPANGSSSLSAAFSTPGAMTSGELRADSALAHRGESMSDAFLRVTKANRSLIAQVKMLQEEGERYKGDLARVNETVNDINSVSMTTDKDVAHLADELQIERSNHERARRELEQKTREVQMQATRLAELDHASSQVHRENLELSGRIQELNRVAEEQECAAAAAASAAALAPSGGVAVGSIGPGAGEKGEREWNAELEALQSKLTKAEGGLEYKTRQLEVVNERANKTTLELLHYKGMPRSGRFVKFFRGVWSLARAVGFLGFMLFAYVAVSEDAFRSHGIDVYRLAH